MFYIFFIILKQPFTPQDYQRCLAILNDLLSNISPRQVKITPQRKSSIFKKCVFIIDFQQVFVHRANIFQTIIWCNYSWIRTNTVAYTIINVLQFVGNMQKGESQDGGNTKIKHAKFSEKRTFLTPWYAAYQGVRNVRFSENLACFVFL